jgi:surface polysaccharide O-acyltransferase-like enzyme
MVQKIEKPLSARKNHLDLLRAIACLSVVMIHVSAEYVVRGSAGADFWLGNLLDSLSRAGVPLFVMISGAAKCDIGGMSML